MLKKTFAFGCFRFLNESAIFTLHYYHDIILVCMQFKCIVPVHVLFVIDSIYVAYV